jgi:hypothetical protein
MCFLGLTGEAARHHLQAGEEYKANVVLDSVQNTLSDVFASIRN